MNYPIGLTCQELVELVTEYLENSLEADARARFELHLGVCPGCVDYLDQMRQTIRATGRLHEETLDPGIRDTLLEAFRWWRVTPRESGDTERVWH
jgi:anti-sigma factor RsiW